MNLLPRRFPSARIVGRVPAPIHVRNSEIAFYLIFSLLSWSDTVQRPNDIFHRTTSIMKVSELWIDSLPLILFHAIVAALVFAAAYLVNRFFVGKIIERFAVSVEMEPHLTNTLKKFGSLMVYLIAVSIILANLGVSGILYGLLASAGFAGIVVGMAARQVFADILSGIVLLAQKPFKVGDPVVVGSESGQVEAMVFWGVTLRAWSGEKVLISNSKVSQSIIKNFNIDSRRAEITFLVDYRSDIRSAMKICRDLLMENSEVLKDPGPTLLVGDFKEAGMELQLFFWLPVSKFFSTGTIIRRQILENLSKEGVKIAVPQIRIVERSEDQQSTSSGLG